MTQKVATERKMNWKQFTAGKAIVDALQYIKM